MKRKNQLNLSNPRDAKILAAREEQKSQLSFNRTRIGRNRTLKNPDSKKNNN